MYARVVHFAGTGEALERGVDAYREQVLPYVTGVSGFRGHTILVDRAAGRAMSITLWATSEALAGYEPAADRFRELLAATWGTPVERVETYEVPLLDLGGA